MYKKYYLYAHGGSHNHGCEALVRTTIDALELSKNETTVVSHNPDEDSLFKIDSICNLVSDNEYLPLKRFSKEFIKSYFDLKINKNEYAMDFVGKVNALGVKKDDIALSIGGDNYCYGSNLRWLCAYNKAFKTYGAKTVLWGCSIDSNVLANKNVINDLAKYDLITARESITYNLLKDINPKTILTCDSAFFLKPAKASLPSNISEENLLGINVGSLINDYESEKGIVLSNYCYLIERVLKETNLSILLIPHVEWKNSNDTQMLSIIYDKFKSSNRIILLPECGCCEAKWYISQCKFFIASRTHASIAAYSSGVPTLVVGYSTKSKGIALDLFGTFENYVLPAEQLSHVDDLYHKFCWLQQNEQMIHNILFDVLPSYKAKIKTAIDAVKRI